MPDDTQAKYPVLKQQLLQECESMVEFIATSGGRVPQEAIQALETARDLSDLMAVHGQLTQLVAPATPMGIVLMKAFKRPGFSLLGPIPLVRGMMLFAFLCLMTYVTINLGVEDIGLKEDTVEQLQAGGVGERAAETATLAKKGTLTTPDPFEVMLLALAGLGASFASLFEINKRIVQRNFDPDSQSSYWLKCFLGLIAGFILATLIPFSAGARDFSQPLLALLGGFSGSAVHRILIRLVEALESLVKGSSQELVEAHERTVKARSAEELLQQRTKLAVSVMQLRQKLAGSTDQQAVNSALDSLLGALVSPDDPMKARALSLSSTAANLQAAAHSAAETRHAVPSPEAASGAGSASDALRPLGSV